MNRLANESAPAFDAFRIYCELGVERSVRLVSEKCGKNQSLIARWCVKHLWVKRAAEYDKNLLQIALKAEESKLVKTAGLWAKRMLESREEAFQNANKLIEKAEAMLKFPLAETLSQDGKTVVKPGKWTFSDVARMLDVANKLKQLATGLPTDRHEHSGPNGEALPTGAPQVVFYVPSNERDQEPTA